MRTVVPTSKPATAIFRPDCPVCRKQMMLARIEPAGIGQDLQTFECTTCQHNEVMVVEFRSEH